MPSELFTQGRYQMVETGLKTFLNDPIQTGYLSPADTRSPRAVGDILQDLIGKHFYDLIRDDAKNYSSEFARRSMADLAFEDNAGFYHIVDVKTHRLSGMFSMPNLTSVERLTRFYEADNNIFVVLIVKYEIENQMIQVDQVHFVPIEYLDWSCLTIGALGWGQIQIRDANHLVITPTTSRKAWMLKFFDVLDVFYPREIEKIQERMLHFQKIRALWEARPG